MELMNMKLKNCKRKKEEKVDFNLEVISMCFNRLNLKQKKK